MPFANDQTERGYAPAGYNDRTAGSSGIAYRQQVNGGQSAQQRRRQLPNTNGYAFSFGEPDDDDALWQNELSQPPQRFRPRQQEERPKTAPAERAPSSGEDKPARKGSGARKNAPVPSTGKLVRDVVIIIGMIAVFTVCSAVMLASGIKQSEAPVAQKSYFEDLNTELIAFKSDSLSAIYSIPKVFLLPWGEQPAPIPNPSGYGSEVAEDGATVLTYKDDTITVRYWQERLYRSDVHFAEIWISHPTQLRTAYADGVFGTAAKKTPQDMARDINAVIAINADYCGYRSGGIIIRQNQVYRDTPRGWDILLIDSRGDFHVMRDKDVEKSGVLEDYDIVNTLQFGPSLVVDGEIKLLNIHSGCGPTWNEEHQSPRTAVGQIGELHYLFCCVEGRSTNNAGVITSEMAKIMLDKGCVQAYNLDGGQSTTMVFNGNAMNDPLWGGQRVVTDILYCATAIPNEESGGADE